MRYVTAAPPPTAGQPATETWIPTAQWTSGISVPIFAAIVFLMAHGAIDRPGPATGLAAIFYMVVVGVAFVSLGCWGYLATRTKPVGLAAPVAGVPVGFYLADLATRVGSYGCSHATSPGPAIPGFPGPSDLIHASSFAYSCNADAYITGPVLGIVFAMVAGVSTLGGVLLAARARAWAGPVVMMGGMALVTALAWGSVVALWQIRDTAERAAEANQPYYTPNLGIALFVVALVAAVAWRRRRSR